MYPLLIISHLLALLLPFIVLLHASPSPAPEPAPAPAVVSLPARQPQFATGRLELGRIEEEHDLLPFVLVSTIDGGLHAVDRADGKVRWSLKEGVEPLVGGGITGKGLEEFIVEPLTGGLYVFEDEEGGDTPKIRKLPLTVEQLINISPFTFRESPSRIFTGSKHTSLLALDLRTGEQLDFFSSHNTNLSRAPVCENDQLLDEMDRSARSNRDTLFVGRTDYRLVIHSKPHQTGSSVSQSSLSGRPDSDQAEGVQEIVYSTYTPNSYDKPLAEYWAKVGAEQRMWEEDGKESKRMRVELRYDGLAFGVEQGGGVKWFAQLDSVGIAVYDILMPLSHASANPILVPQPPFVGKSPSQRQKMFGQPPSTYIASVPSYLTLPPGKTDGQPNHSNVDHSDNMSSRPLVYALSSESYPLVNIAPLPRPGALADGLFVMSDELPYHEQLLPYLLDPPAEDSVPAITDQEEKTPLQPPRQRFGTTSLWWIIGVLCSIILIGATVTRWHRQTSVKQTPSPTEERSSLLAEMEKPVLSEKTVTAIDHAESSVNGTANGHSSSLEEVDSTPKKKSNRRRVRGKKKKGEQSVAFAIGEDDDEDEDKGEGSSGSSPHASPPATVLRKDEKPLPDLPRVMTATDLAEGDKDRLKVTDIELGRGSHGTVVYKGAWGDRPVAVKRLLSEFTQLASREVRLLQASDDHANVIRYYCQEKRDNFLYIALDLCDASLADLVESPNRHVELASALDRRKALIQITSGVKHLHDMKIIHRDIKPQNVLVSRVKDGSLRMLVSDFGLARQLDQGQSSFAPTANNHAGSLGWRAPECIRGQVKLSDVLDPNSTVSSSSSSASLVDLGVDIDLDGKGKGKARQGLTKAVDLFALGCLYFWVLMNGEHPFGEAYDRESNIVKGDVVNMSQLDVLFEEGFEAKELIGRMLSTDPTLRPETGACLVHPFFWTPAKRLAFLCDASDRFEIMELEPPEATLVMLETDAASIVGKDWYSRLDKVFINNLGKYRKYKGNSVRDLLRAMRNKKHHYQDLEPVVKRHLGNLPNGFLHYFTSRYPNLFLHVHSVVRDSRLRHESMFEGYFAEGG